MAGLVAVHGGVTVASGRSPRVIDSLRHITNGLCLGTGLCGCAVRAESCQGSLSHWNGWPANPSNPIHLIRSRGKHLPGVGDPRQVVGRVGKGGKERFACGCVRLASPMDATIEFYHMP